MMCQYLNVQFQGQRLNRVFGMTEHKQRIVTSSVATYKACDSFLMKYVVVIMHTSMTIEEVAFRLLCLQFYLLKVIVKLITSLWLMTRICERQEIIPTAYLHFVSKNQN